MGMDAERLYTPQANVFFCFCFASSSSPTIATHIHTDIVVVGSGATNFSESAFDAAKRECTYLKSNPRSTRSPSS